MLRCAAVTAGIRASPVLRLALAVATSAAATGAQAADGVRLVGLLADNTLLRFDSERPHEVERLAVQGVVGTLLGLDLRPADGRLYAVTDTYDLYTIDPTTGTAQQVSTLTVAFDGGPHSGVDFNPQTDRLRLVGGNGQNLRVHAELGAAAADTSVAYAPGDPNFGRRPALAAAAYTRAVAGTPETQLFTIDSTLDLLALQDPPNDGTLATVGPLGSDFEPQAGFDITTDAGGRDHAYAASGSRLYAIDLATGEAHLLGTIGVGELDLLGLVVLGRGGEAPTSSAGPPGA